MMMVTEYGVHHYDYLFVNIFTKESFYLMGFWLGVIFFSYFIIFCLIRMSEEMQLYSLALSLVVVLLACYTAIFSLILGWNLWWTVGLFAISEILLIKWVIKEIKRLKNESYEEGLK